MEWYIPVIGLADLANISLFMGLSQIDAMCPVLPQRRHFRVADGSTQSVGLFAVRHSLVDA